MSAKATSQVLNVPCVVNNPYGVVGLIEIPVMFVDAGQSLAMQCQQGPLPLSPIFKSSDAYSPLLCLQQSLLTVLKESFKIYKAISEGLINMADRFFEMEYLDAHKGLEVYKESIVANERLQQYYQQVEQIEELNRTIQFPKLESPPADFLAQMEAYAKEAPRPYDEATGVAGSKKVHCIVKTLHSKHMLAQQGIWLSVHSAECLPQIPVWSSF